MQVSLNGALRSAADGNGSVDVDATTIRELITNLVERFPKLSGEVDKGVAVAIDGVVYRDDWTVRIPDDAEVFLMPRIAGG